MSKKEIKDEVKNQEGNPEIKAKIKQKQREISMQRMMQDVPMADVVITNPTHFAVAIAYKPEVRDAPYCIARGQDYVAFRIKEAARAHNVKVIENKPLARALYASMEVGQEVPQELYQAVAEVLAFIYSLDAAGKGNPARTGKPA
jgi:flagellar biosynthesis protein FlhB